MNEEDMPILDSEPVELPFENTSQRYMEFYSGKWALDKALKVPNNEEKS